MSKLSSMKMPLTDAQLRKLAKGQGVRVTPSSGASAYDIYCSPAKMKRMQRNMTKGKGFTVKLDPDELRENEVEIEGGRINWKKIGRTLRSTAKSIGKFYREDVRPIVGPAIRTAVKTAIEKGIPLAASTLGTLTGNPAMAAAAAPAISKLSKRLAEKGTEKLSKLTGAFGVGAPAATKAVKAKAKKPRAPRAKKTQEPCPVIDDSLYTIEHTEREPLPYRPQLQDNYSNFLNPNHPAMNPTLPTQDNSLPLVPRHMRGMRGKGLYAGKGLFAGGGLYAGQGLYVAERGGAMLTGLPMNPLLPPVDNSTYL